MQSAIFKDCDIYCVSCLIILENVCNIVNVICILNIFSVQTHKLWFYGWKEELLLESKKQNVRTLKSKNQQQFQRQSERLEGKILTNNYKYGVMQENTLICQIPVQVFPLLQYIYWNRIFILYWKTQKPPWTCTSCKDLT